jgi:hypothetical protein
MKLKEEFTNKLKKEKKNKCLILILFKKLDFYDYSVKILGLTLLRPLNIILEI